MKKYEVSWDEIFHCKKVVEAESMEEAIEKCYNCDDPDRREFEGYSDWEAYSDDDDDDDDGEEV